MAPTMKTVNQLLEGKNFDIWSVTPQTTVREALSLMAEKNIGALLVMEEEELVGIFSERDYARDLREKPARAIPVEDTMSKKVTCIEWDQTIDDCMEIMTDKRIRHLPVLKDARVIGMISIGDVVKDIISTQRLAIKQLENYITGNR